MVPGFQQPLVFRRITPGVIGIPESRASRIIPGFDLSEGPFTQIETWDYPAGTGFRNADHPWSYASKNEWLLKTWDHHRIPKPFNRIRGTFGEPLMVPKNLELESIPEYCGKLEEAMKQTAEYAAWN